MASCYDTFPISELPASKYARGQHGKTLCRPHSPYLALPCFARLPVVLFYGTIALPPFSFYGGMHSLQRFALRVKSLHPLWETGWVQWEGMGFW